LKRNSGCDIDVSRLFIYYNARAKDEESGEKIEDSGCTITSAIESLEESGTCHESIWPYDVKRVNKCPNSEAYGAAENHKINDALQVKLNLHEMKSCLAQGLPIVFGLELYKSFDKAEKKGIVPMPKPGDKSRESHGRSDLILIEKIKTNPFVYYFSHGMLAVGYSDQSKAFIVRNSWGTEWVNQYLFRRKISIYLYF
jgi:C1A family cysteine protease